MFIVICLWIKLTVNQIKIIPNDPNEKFIIRIVCSRSKTKKKQNKTQKKEFINLYVYEIFWISKAKEITRPEKKMKNKNWWHKGKFSFEKEKFIMKIEKANMMTVRAKKKNKYSKVILKTFVFYFVKCNAFSSDFVCSGSLSNSDIFLI